MIRGRGGKKVRKFCGRHLSTVWLLRHLLIEVKMISTRLSPDVCEPLVYEVSPDEDINPTDCVIDGLQAALTRVAHIKSFVAFLPYSFCT